MFLLTGRRTLISHSEAEQHCLLLLQANLQFRYAQWIIEDSNHDYRVIASVTSTGERGYDIAHRTGIIGQVFRTSQPIFATDVRRHILYDSFDDAIDWELCFPIFRNNRLYAVINLEGAGTITLTKRQWNEIRQSIKDVRRCEPPVVRPRTNSMILLNTQQIVVPSEVDDSEIVETARNLASTGASTVLVGDYPDLVCGRGPTVAEALARNLPMSYCFFGVEKQLDLLATGPGLDLLEQVRADCWHQCKGRYSFVVVSEANKLLATE